MNRSDSGLDRKEQDFSWLSAVLDDPNFRFPQHPRFAPDLHIFEMPDGLGIQIRGSEAPVILRGHLVANTFAHLRKWMDGSLSVKEILENRPQDLSETALLRSLFLLQLKGCLVDESAVENDYADLVGKTPNPAQLLYWGRALPRTLHNKSIGEIQEKINRARVLVLGSGQFGATTVDLLSRSGCRSLAAIGWRDEGEMLSILSSADIPLSPAVNLEDGGTDSVLKLIDELHGEADLLVTALRRAPHSLFEAIDRSCIDKGLTWLCGKDDGSTFEIGPLVLPRKSACYTCFLLRSDSAHPLPFEEDYFNQSLDEAAESKTLLGEALVPATIGSSHVAMETIRFLTGLSPFELVNTVLTIEPLAGIYKKNHFRRYPRCPGCGAVEHRPTGAK